MQLGDEEEQLDHEENTKTQMHGKEIVNRNLRRKQHPVDLDQWVDRGIGHRNQWIEAGNLGRTWEKGSEDTPERSELERPKSPVFRHVVSWQIVKKKYGLRGWVSLLRMLWTKM